MLKTSAILTKVGNKIDTSKYFLTLSDDELKVWQDELYEMLCDVVDILEENNIKYTLSGGTCLGAVRHNDFIPWDDDIDLNIFRLDYNNISKVIESSRFKDKYTVFLAGESHKPITKGVIRRNDKSIKDIFPHKDIRHDARMYIDIYSVENIPNNKILRVGLGIITTLTNVSITSNGYSKKNNPMIHEVANYDTSLKVNLIIRWLLSLFTKPFMYCGKIKNKPILFMNYIYTKLAKVETDYSTIYSGSKRYFGEILKTEDYLPGKKMIFRDRTFWIPANYDKYLKNLYGDYMKIPDHVERKIHFHTYDF